MTAGGQDQIALDCRHLVELVTAYLEGGLDRGTAALVEAHLELCEPCVTYLEQVRQSVRALHRAPLGALSDERKQALLAEFRRATTTDA